MLFSVFSSFTSWSNKSFSQLAFTKPLFDSLIRTKVKMKTNKAFVKRFRQQSNGHLKYYPSHLGGKSKTITLQKRERTYKQLLMHNTPYIRIDRSLDRIPGIKKKEEHEKLKQRVYNK